MNIETVKLRENSWLINNEYVVFDVEGAKGRTEVLEWLAQGNTPEPEFTPTQLETLRIQAIKTEAMNRILDILPEWKQRNLLARSIELQNKLYLGIITADEQSEMDALQSQWDSIKAIRETSDAAELAGTAPEDIVW